MAYEIPDDRVPVARAWIYAGELVASCPRPADPLTGKGCGGVEYLYQASRIRGPRDTRKPFFQCSNCGQQASIEWPRREVDLLAVLMLRPVPETRNWYPADHPDAVHWNLPSGQSVKDLLAENEEHGIDNSPLRGLN